MFHYWWDFIKTFCKNEKQLIQYPYNSVILKCKYHLNNQMYIVGNYVLLFSFILTNIKKLVI